MAVDATSSATNTTNTTSTKTGAAAISKDDFLKILIAQIKYQDPLSPMEPNEFMSQLAQMTQVEQLTNMASSLDALKTATEKGSMSQWLSSIGKKMSVDDNVLSQGDEIFVSPTADYDYIVLTLTKSDGSTSEVKFNKGETPAYVQESEDTVEAGAVAVKSGTPVTCNLSLYRVIRGVQMGDTGPVMLAGDGTAYDTTKVKLIKE